MDDCDATNNNSVDDGTSTGDESGMRSGTTAAAIGIASSHHMQITFTVSFFFTKHAMRALVVLAIVVKAYNPIIS